VIRLTRPGRRAGRSRGQGLVEFALVIPLFLLAMFGLIDVARLVYLNSTVSQAAREGARLAAVEASWMGSTGAGCNTAGGPVCPTDAAALATHVRDAANRMMTPFGAVENVHVQCVAEGAAAPTTEWTGVSCPTANRTPSRDQVWVRVTAPFNAITPVASQLIGAVTLSGSSTFVIN
jgi:hypothetical protein